MVSVVCTNYNKGDWIRDAIESFLNQKVDFTFEILIIDDKSTDHSAKIIKEYAKKYPEKIRAFYNKKNLGITKTWTKICKEANGRYIARCDGDDYWIDERKLQKQVELLEKADDSKWCSTDYDIVTPGGKTIHKSAFETGLVDRSKSYAQMLVVKGFTMASTWMVDTNLMRNINDNLDVSAVDDTFNIQLDLFKKTKLTYLPESTVVYRINEGSDSRPVDIKDIVVRNNKLLKTQLEYIDKYKDVDYAEMLKMVLPKNMEFELQAIERLQIVREQERIMKWQSAHIKNLEQKIKIIENARWYKFVTKISRIINKSVSLPKKIVNKIRWIEGRQRYSKFYIENLPDQSVYDAQKRRADRFAYQPLISIVVPTYNTSPVFFDEMLKSVKRQTYANWELVFVDDASPEGTVRELIQEAASDDERISYKFLKKNHHIAGATNKGFAIAKGEYVSLLDHDDILHPSALYEIVKALNENRNLKFIYTDEDKIDERYRHIDPFIKPDWNQEFLYSVNYITHFTTIHKSVIDKIGGERKEYNGAQDWDLFLRATRSINSEDIHHIPKILYSWRVHNASTAKNLETKPYVFEAQRNLLTDYFREKGLSEDQFSIEENQFMQGAWNVTYDGQDESTIHRSGDKVNFSTIRGLSKTEEEIVRHFGQRSLVNKIYTDCQYTVEEDTSGREHA